MLNVITAVFNRHDLLRGLAASLANSIVQPDRFYVVDHGYDDQKLREAIAEGGFPADKLHVVTLEDPSAAVYYNWAMTHIDGTKIFCSDDIWFFPHALGYLASAPGGFVTPQMTNYYVPFACFKLTDEFYQKIGPVDESISPRYLYFEDCDYGYRIKLAGEKVTMADSAIVEHVHSGSQSIAAYTPKQLAEHHGKFILARQNYVFKWGGEPMHETYTTPYNR